MSEKGDRRRPGVIARYREFLPVTDRTPVVTLMEGNTPLIRCHRLTAAINPKIDLFLKYEGANPTGSFKDRGCSVSRRMYLVS